MTEEKMKSFGVNPPVGLRSQAVQLATLPASYASTCSTNAVCEVTGGRPML